MKKHKYLLCLFLLITVSCTKNNEPKVKESIENTIRKFPQLKSNSTLLGNDYTLVKSVKNGNPGFEIQLLSEPDSIKGKQEIIVFINSKNECFPIPFFSNRYKDYWDFPFDQPIPGVAKTNSNFTKELNAVLNKITPKENPKKGEIDFEIINELLYSVLHCRHIEDQDSTLVYNKLYMNLDIPEESFDSAHIRLRKNYELMKEDWYPNKNISNHNCYLDEKNARIYQIRYNSIKKQYLFKAYRLDYGFRYIYL